MDILIALRIVPGYLVSGLMALPRDVRVTVIAMPKGTHPSECPLPVGVREINRERLKTVEDVSSALQNATPDVYVCCGWADALYLKLAKQLKGRGCKTVLAIDTPWRCDLRQIVNTLVSRITLVPGFDYAWGAGDPQALYLRILGFANRRIYTGYYSADTAKFTAVYKKRAPNPPHVFVYVGRYAPEKNMRLMEKAFLMAVAERSDCDWRLVCIGGGGLWDERTLAERITHLGYKPPDVIQNFIEECGCFVLPSLYEPWGVVVHEFATAGVPMICSRNVKATTAYLKEGENGFLFNPNDVDDIKQAFLKIIDKTDRELMAMGEASRRLGISYTTNDWVARIQSFAQTT